MPGNLRKLNGAAFCERLRSGALTPEQAAEDIARLFEMIADLLDERNIVRKNVEILTDAGSIHAHLVLSGYLISTGEARWAVLPLN